MLIKIIYYAQDVIAMKKHDDYTTNYFILLNSHQTDKNTHNIIAQPVLTKGNLTNVQTITKTVLDAWSNSFNPKAYSKEKDYNLLKKGLEELAHTLKSVARKQQIDFYLSRQREEHLKGNYRNFKRFEEDIFFNALEMKKPLQNISDIIRR